MKIKFGAIVVDGRNKIGGHVMCKNRAGSYMRTKVTPVNPRSVGQMTARNLLGSLASAWRALDPAEILAWNSAVDQWKRTDIFGDLKKPSGFNLFQRLNNNAIRCNGVQMDVPPTPVTLSSLGDIAVTTLTPTSIIITCALDALLLNEVVECLATPGLSPGISFVKSELRLVSSSQALVAYEVTLTDPYAAKFGAVGGSDGKKYFFALRIVNNLTGQAGVYRMCSKLNT